MQYATTTPSFVCTWKEKEVIFFHLWANFHMANFISFIREPGNIISSLSKVKCELAHVAQSRSKLTSDCSFRQLIHPYHSVRWPTSELELISAHPSCRPGRCAHIGSGKGLRMHLHLQNHSINTHMPTMPIISCNINSTLSNFSTGKIFCAFFFSDYKI